MRALPKSFKHVLGAMTLILMVSAANADPKIISTYKARNSAETEDGSGGNTGSSGNTGTTSSSTTATGSANKAATTYTIPSNFNFNCSTRNPKADAIENGRRAYVRLNCTVCHSSTGHGGTMGPSLVDAGGDVAEAVTQGQEGGMPSFKKYLCPNDIADLTAYINTLGSKASPDFTDWWVTNPPAPFVDSAP